jgi:hypothetical protein
MDEKVVLGIVGPCLDGAVGIAFVAYFEKWARFGLSFGAVVGKVLWVESQVPSVMKTCLCWRC